MLAFRGCNRILPNLPRTSHPIFPVIERLIEGNLRQWRVNYATQLSTKVCWITMKKPDCRRAERPTWRLNKPPSYRKLRLSRECRRSASTIRLCECQPLQVFPGGSVVANGWVSQNPRRAKPTQLRANIEQAIAVSETNVATALMGCMTEP